jgi:anti-sigma factor RsiW
MKDHRFIELLNLYIDRQITAAETAELEAEIQQNPGRQAVYRQYCKIHSATKLVYDSFRANAAEQPAFQPNPAGDIELFDSKRGKRQWALYAGGLAAAACLALVFMRDNTAPKGAEVLTAGNVEARTAVAVIPPVEVARVETREMVPAVSLVSLRNSEALSPDYTAMLAALREQDEERAFANNHLNGHAASLFDDTVFSPSRTPTPSQDPRPLRIRPTPTQQAEFTAFQFQR